MYRGRIMFLFMIEKCYIHKAYYGVLLGLAETS